MKIVVAIDSLKGSLTSIQAGEAIEKGINDVVFDRGGYVYHGRVEALASGAREAGLKF